MAEEPGPSLEVPGADSSAGDRENSADKPSSLNTKPATAEPNGAQSADITPQSTAAQTDISAHTDIPLDTQVSSDSGAKVESPSGKRSSSSPNKF